MRREAEAMTTLAVRIDLADFHRLRNLARQRGLVTLGGKPVVSLAAREVIRAGLDLAEREAVGHDTKD